MKKSIWFISKYASPPQSRGGQRGISLATEFVRAGHDAAVITSTSNHLGMFRKNEGRLIELGFTKFFFKGVTVLAHKTISYTRTASARRVISWLHFEWGLLRLPIRHLPRPTHIIVSSLSLLSILNGYRFARMFHAKLVFEIRDIWPLTLQAEFGMPQKHPMVSLLSAIERFGYLKSDVVVGTMPNLREHVNAVLGTPVRVETVALGIDEDLKRLTKDYVAPTPNKSPMIVGYFGSIGRTNSLETLFEAATKLGPQQNLEFHFWGTGDREQHFRKRYGSRPHIFLHGQVTREHLFSEVEKCDIFILATPPTSLFSFGQSSNKLLEYMLLGRPVIACYSGFPSMLTEAKSGVFVPADDTDALIKSLIEFRDLPDLSRQSMGLRGRTWVVENRNYELLSFQYLEILDSL